MLCLISDVSARCLVLCLIGYISAHCYGYYSYKTVLCLVFTLAHTVLCCI